MTDFDDDEHLDVCQNIEVGLKKQYELNPALTDAICIFALDNSSTVRGVEALLLARLAYSLPQRHNALEAVRTGIAHGAALWRAG